MILEVLERGFANDEVMQVRFRDSIPTGVG